MAVGRKTGGRKKGTPNKSKKPTVVQLAKRMVEERQLAGELEKQTPLEFLLTIMHDETYPPGARIECAKAALPFCHAKKAEEPSEKAVQITEIRRVIIDPRDNPNHPRHQEVLQEELAARGIDRAARGGARNHRHTNCCGDTTR